MKAILILSALFCMAYAADTYQLVWSDEFNGNSLDTSKWQYEVNCDGGGNNELQCYTSNANNLKVANGQLTITAVPQSYNGKQYTSARINTMASAAWKYGQFVISAKMPNGAYLWPALWMMPRDSVYGGWAASGEIDIFEGKGQNPSEYQSTLHYGAAWPNNVYQGSGAQTYSADLTAAFHTYTCTWTPDSITFAIDGNTYYTRSLQENFYGGQGTDPYTKNGQPFDQYFFFIINVAIGGGFFGAQANALNTDMARGWANPNMVVDYVRVYQLGSSPIVVPPVPVPNSVNPTSAKTSATSATQSVGISTVGSSAASTVISTAATSTVVSKETTAQTTFYYSAPKASSAATSNNVPATSSSSKACPTGCGAGSCCADVKLGGVCYDTNNYQCVADTDGLHLCAKGLGYCKQTGCYNASMYKCVNGALSLL